MSRAWLLVAALSLAGCRVHVVADAPPPGHDRGPMAGGPPPPGSVLHAKEIKADRVYARVIHCKELKAKGGNIRHTSSREGGGHGKGHEGWGNDEIKAAEVRADTIYAKEIKAEWVEADEVHCKEVKIGH